MTSTDWAWYPGGGEGRWGIVDVIRRVLAQHAPLAVDPNTVASTYDPSPVGNGSWRAKKRRMTQQVGTVAGVAVSDPRVAKPFQRPLRR